MVMCNGQMRMVVPGCYRDCWLSLVGVWRVGICSNGCVDGELRKVWCLLEACSLAMMKSTDGFGWSFWGASEGLG